MTKDEFAYWQSRIENSRFQWAEDEIFRLNKRGAFYYNGGEDGIYIKIHKDGLVEAGTYKDAFPHIGDASFFVKSKRQCADYNEAFSLAMNAGGKKFLMDMFSGDAVPPPGTLGRAASVACDQPAPTEKPSVVSQIKAARHAPKDSPSDTPSKNKSKGGPEL